MHIITSLLRGGAEVMLSRFLELVDGSRVECRVVSLGERGPVAGDIERLGIPIDFLGVRSSLPGLGTLLSLARAAKRFRPDLVQGWMYHANLAASAAALPLGARTIWGIRQSVSPTLVEEKATTRRVIRLGARLSRFPDRVVYNSHEGFRAHTAIGYHPGRARVVPNGFDTGRFRPDADAGGRVRGELGLAQDELVIGMAGRFHPVKDHHGLLEAARLATGRGMSARFLLVGREVDRGNSELMRWIESKGLRGSVIPAGERLDMPAVFAAIDLAVSPSRSESFSNAIGEAMACGVPCVVTGVGDSARIVGDTGMVVPPGRPDALADAMAEMCRSGREALRDRGRRARERISREFSLGTMTSRYMEIYNDLVPEGRPV